MKKIFKLMLLPALVLPLLFTSCDEDRDSNPTLDLSHLAEGFVLNTPALAENNTYDLKSAKKLVLTCSQPNYGDAPYAVRYYAQVSLDPAPMILHPLKQSCRHTQRMQATWNLMHPKQTMLSYHSSRQPIQTQAFLRKCLFTSVFAESLAVL